MQCHKGISKIPMPPGAVVFVNDDKASVGLFHQNIGESHPHCTATHNKIVC